MILARTRTALDQASREVEELVQTAQNPVEFGRRFVTCCALLARVGTTLNNESQGHRTPQFGAWWKRTAQDPRYKLFHAIRNTELKEGQKTHVGIVTGGPPAPTQIPPVVRAGHARPGRARGFRSGARRTSIVPGLLDMTYQLTPAYGGGDAIELVLGYHTWFTDDVIPTAESLTG
jgi:hypothetical protein